VNQRLSAERLQQLLASERAQREVLEAEVTHLRQVAGINQQKDGKFLSEGILISFFSCI